MALSNVCVWNLCLTACGVSMNTLSGTFSSPGYPAGYPFDSNCAWEIKVPSGNIITLKFV